MHVAEATLHVQYIRLCLETSPPSNCSHGYYLRVAIILLSANATATTIRGRLLFEGGYYSRKYGIHKKYHENYFVGGTERFVKIGIRKNKALYNKLCSKCADLTGVLVAPMCSHTSLVPSLDSGHENSVDRWVNAVANTSAWINAI